MPVQKHINSDQFAFRDIQLLMNGMPAVTLQSVSIQRSVNRIPVRTHKRKVAFHKVGNTSYTGELSVLHSTIQYLILPGVDLTDAPFVISLILGADSKILTYTLIGCHFTSWSINYNQGDLSGIVSLPFVAKELVGSPVPPEALFTPYEKTYAR